MMKPFATIATAVFSIAACLHFLRLLMDWEVSIAGVFVPYVGELSRSASRRRPGLHALARIAAGEGLSNEKVRPHLLVSIADNYFR